MSTSQQDRIYIPILREGRNERHVIREFGGLGRYNQLREGKLLVPLIEITSPQDFNNITPYRNAGDRLLVELPKYLSQQNNGLREDVEDLLENYQNSQSRFYVERKNEIDVPVVSGQLDNSLVKTYQEVKGEFKEVAVRMFLDRNMTSSERRVVDLLAAEVDRSDWVIFDIVETTDLSGGNYDHLGYLADAFAQSRTIIANAMNVFDGEAYNWGPEIARDKGLDGFGDFAVNGRYPPVAIPNFHEATKTLRHYGVGDFEINEFSGDDYEEAAVKLESWKEWKQSHCPFCRQLGSREDDCTRHMAKQVRVGHYIHSVLETDLEWLAQAESREGVSSG